MKCIRGEVEPKSYEHAWEANRPLSYFSSESGVGVGVGVGVGSTIIQSFVIVGMGTSYVI